MATFRMLINVNKIEVNKSAKQLPNNFFFFYRGEVLYIKVVLIKKFKKREKFRIKKILLSAFSQLLLN